MSEVPKVGELDRLITVQTATPSRTTDGGVTYSYATAGTLWAKFEEKPSNEQEEDGKLTPVMGAVFVIRDEGLTITSQSRIIWDGDTYEVQRIVEIGRNRFKRIEAKLI